MKDDSKMSIILPFSIQTNVVNFGPEQLVYYPKVIGAEQWNWQRAVNEQIAKQSQELVSLQAGAFPTDLKTMLGYYEIKNNQRNVLSLTQLNYAYHEHAAHGMTYLRSLTFNHTNKEAYTLSQLFLANSDYVGRLSELVAQQIKSRSIETFEPFHKIAPEQSFYIADKALVLYYQLYDITPYVFGFPIFPISVYEIADIIEEDAPLGAMLENN